MSGDFTAPTPELVAAFEMRLTRAATLSVGETGTGGERAYVAVTGGSFIGEALAGRIVGGGETLLARADGVTMVEASYLIVFDGGATARGFGTGYRTASGLRVSLLFEAAQDGPVAALATRAFVAEQPQGSDIMTIFRII